MTILNGYTNPVPHHRQNRRRERPGSRTRRTISRRFNIQDECEQGILDAKDFSIPLPSDKTKPSPLLRQNFDQSWQRWKARHAEEAAQAEMDKLQLDHEHMLLFGGEVDDDVSLCAPMLRVVMFLFDDIDYTDLFEHTPIIDLSPLLFFCGGVGVMDKAERVGLRILLRQELFSLGILYSDDGEQQDCESHANGNAVLCDVPLSHEAHIFVVRPSRRSRRQR